MQSGKLFEMNGAPTTRHLLRMELSREAESVALRLSYRADSLGLQSAVFSGEGGVVALAFYGQGERSLEAIIEPDGSISYSAEKGHGFSFEVLGESEDASTDEIVEWMHRIAGKPTWNSSESFVPTGGTSTKAGSQILFFESPQSRTGTTGPRTSLGAYLYSTSSARSDNLEKAHSRYVST